MGPGLQIGWLVVNGEQLMDWRGGWEERKYVSIYVDHEVGGEERRTTEGEEDSYYVC